MTTRGYDTVMVPMVSLVLGIPDGESLERVRCPLVRFLFVLLKSITVHERLFHLSHYIFPTRLVMLRKVVL